MSKLESHIPKMVKPQRLEDQNPESLFGGELRPIRSTHFELYMKEKYMFMILEPFYMFRFVC